MLAATGRRAIHPLVVELADELFAPEQIALFVGRPEGRLAVAEGKGLPPSLGRGAEIEGGAGLIGRVFREGRALDASDVPGEGGIEGLRVDVAAPFRETDGQVSGVLAVGGARRALGDARRVLSTIGDLASLAMGHADQLRQAQNAADLDGLTHLYNKPFLNRRLTEMLKRAPEEKSPLGLLLLDIDHFKNYNDTNGHLAGDEALKTVALLLKRSVREDDLVARYGGEEFVILYVGASKSLACRLAQGVRRAVEAYEFPGGDRQPLGALTISGGVAGFPDDAADAVSLLRAADAALYEAKAAGRNKIISA
jgi:diguanylate cyclase (GGDEF)-like protein